MSHKAEIFGKGFRPFDGGGFESVIVNGEEYTPEEIVAAMRAYKMKKFCDAAEQAKPVGCSHCWGDRWMKDGTPCPACNPSGSGGHAHAEQAQAGE